MLPVGCMSSEGQTQLPPRVRFDPETALGWSDVALDGLSCYLRCVESVLRWRGHDSEAVALALGGPVDLLRRGRSGSTYDAHAVEWRIAAEAAAHREQLVATLRSGEPVILMPDRFYWPGDEFEGRRHFHDHMVLAFALEDGVLSVLDTDASAGSEFVRRIPMDAAAWRACTRWGVVRATAGSPRTAEQMASRTLRPSLRLLAVDAVELRAFGERWRRDGIDDPLARALHVAVLGDFQPTLFLFAEAARAWDRGGGLEPVIGPAAAAAKSAKTLGLLLLALHREASDDAYEIAIAAFDRFLDAAEALLASIAGWLGEEPPGGTAARGIVQERLQGLARYCFSSSASVSR